MGVSNAVIGYACFIGALAVLPSLPARASIAQVLSYSSGMAWSYYWNRRWSFGSFDSFTAEGARFVTTQLACLTISAVFVGIAVDILGLPPTPSWVIVMGAIVLLNFALLRFWVFKGMSSEEQAS